jgi:hypothetical protein
MDGENGILKDRITVAMCSGCHILLNMDAVFEPSHI